MKSNDKDQQVCSFCGKPKELVKKLISEKKLYNPKNNKKLKLKDTLIKFKPVDKNKKRWALFIYYSCDKNENNAFYKCFQSKENNVKESIYSLRQSILE